MAFMGIPVLGDAALAVGSGLLSGGLDFIGGERANQANAEIARDTNAWSGRQAQILREWQAKMSNSAHQRQMADLKKAGLNPLLSAGQSGASTPSGAKGDAHTATMENTLKGALSSAGQAASLALAAKKQGTEIGLMDEETKLKKAQQVKTAMETKVMSKGIPEADIKNRAYRYLDKVFDQSNQSSSRTPRADKKAQEWHRKFNNQPPVKINPPR